MVSPKTCKISKGTTLENLADFFNLTKEQLKRYHNIYCPLEDLIGYDIPEHVTIIYVPPQDNEIREKIFNPNGGNFIGYRHKNTLDNKKSYHKKYGVIQKFFHNDEEKLNIHYETEIKKKDLRVEISRHPVYINRQTPELMVEQIADKIGSILYPLELEINENGTIKDIFNFKEIHDRWKKLKPDLKDYYRGQIAEDFILKVETQLKRRKTLQKISGNIFYLLFFLPLYGTFDKEKQYTFSLGIPFWDKNQRTLFEITLLVDEEISETHKFIIKAKGKRIDEENTSINKKKNLKADGFFDFTYKLNSKDNSIFAIYGEMGIKTQELNKKITFECYEQT